MNSRFDPDQVAYYNKAGIKNHSKTTDFFADQQIEPSFFFYDLETSGISPREDRIMQFAGQRTNLDLEPIGEPVNILIKLNNDTLPSPDAIMVTHILPQETVKYGMTEAEFCRIAMNEIFTANTISCGYNSVRFDDEHMRYLFWRNFYDPYEWQWKNGRSRWDLLDVVRMIRALRPEGIKWPIISDPESGRKKPANKLELLARLNRIDHTKAHDALSDVEALIALARLLKEKQPQIFNYLLKMRDKREVLKLVNLSTPRPFVYTSGRYKSDFLNTTIAFPIAPSKNGNLLVFDLRYNLEDLLTAEKEFKSEKKVNRFGKEYMTWFDFGEAVKEICLNKCPAVAPISVLDTLSDKESNDEFSPHPRGASGWEKIQLTPEIIGKNLEILLKHPDFIERMRSLYENRVDYPKVDEVEASLYDGFLPEADRRISQKIQGADAESINEFIPNFIDERLPGLFLHFKGRNFPNCLSEEELSKWEEDRKKRIQKQSKRFFTSLNALKKKIETGEKTMDGRAIDPKILKELEDWYDFCK